MTCLEKLLDLGSNILDCPNEEILLFLFVDGTLLEENEHLETLPDWAPLIVCRPDQKEKLLVYFDIKKAIEAICH